jgi:putative chitinase
VVEKKKMILRELSVVEKEDLYDLSTKQVRELQTALEKIGYDVGEIDGIMGNHTAYAWKRFKQNNNQKHYDLIGSGSVKLLQNKLANPNPIITPSENISTATLDWTNWETPVSRYFTVGEVSKRDEKRIVYNEAHRKNVLKLAKHLDKIREDWGSGIVVTSWYRPPAVNAVCGGAKNSQHLNGSAADIRPVNGRISEFQSWLDKRWDMAMGYGAQKGQFCHVDLRPGRIRWNY